MKIFAACCLICLPLVRLYVTSSFGYRKHPVTGEYAFHNGVDLRARSDTVYALTAGTIAAVRYDELTGVAVTIGHGSFTSAYGHLGSVFVQPGETVDTGQPIGITGRTGRVTGEHLHFSVRVGRRYINPLEFIYQLIQTKHHE
jgi:murein DD-endopeptidase MepM/ murein hydrolase activator NlpD